MSANQTDDSHPKSYLLGLTDPSLSAHVIIYERFGKNVALYWKNNNCRYRVPVKKTFCSRDKLSVLFSFILVLFSFILSMDREEKERGRRKSSGDNLPRDVTKCECACRVLWLRLLGRSQMRRVLSSDADNRYLPPTWNTSPRTQLS